MPSAQEQGWEENDLDVGRDHHMRVTPFSSPVENGKRTGRMSRGQAVASDEGFASLLRPTDPPAAPAISTPALATDVLLACQLDRDRSRRQESEIAYGADLLDALDGLRLALLEGDTDAASVHKLREMIDRSRSGSGDTGLDELAAWVEVRAAVELAKRER